MASKKNKSPVVIGIKRDNRYSSSRSIRIAPAVITTDRPWSERGLRWPETIDGIFTDSGDLGWTEYRRLLVDGETPRALAANLEEVDFREVFSIDRFKAPKIAKAIKTVLARLDKETKKYGYTRDFAEGILRIAHVFGAKYLVIEEGLYAEALGDPRHREVHNGDVWLNVPDEARYVLDAIRDVDLAPADKTAPAVALRTVVPPPALPEASS